MLPAQLPTLRAAGKANSSALALLWGSSPAPDFIPETPPRHHRLPAWSPAWTQSVGCAVLQVFTSGREEFVVQLRSNLIYAFVWGATYAYNPVTTHHRLGRSLENPRSAILCAIVAFLCF